MATKLYFVQQGICEILASDNLTPIAYQGKGCYFGEIGVLLLGKRSVSVKIKSTSILYSIKKHQLLKVLEKFPNQAKFVRAVGRQRILTTHPEDLSDSEKLEDKTEFQMGTLAQN